MPAGRQRDRPLVGRRHVPVWRLAVHGPGSTTPRVTAAVECPMATCDRLRPPASIRLTRSASSARAPARHSYRPCAPNHTRSVAVVPSDFRVTPRDLSVAYVNYSKVLMASCELELPDSKNAYTCDNTSEIDADIGVITNSWIKLANKLWFA